MAVGRSIPTRIRARWVSALARDAGLLQNIADARQTLRFFVLFSFLLHKGIFCCSSRDCLQFASVNGTVDPNTNLGW